MSALQRFTESARTPAQGGDVPGPLRRFLEARERPTPGEVCELCAEPVHERHSHIVEVERRSLVCTCRPCYLLFTQPGAAGGRYKAVPDRHLRLGTFVLTAAQWNALDIPVGMAFFLPHSQLGRVAAFYPSPGGATESELDLEAWAEIAAANPVLSDVEADVEAALIRATDEGYECYVVPIDRCYELVGELRLHWRGFDGGQEVRERIAKFFDDVASRSRPPRAERT